MRKDMQENVDGEWNFINQDNTGKWLIVEPKNHGLPKQPVDYIVRSVLRQKAALNNREKVGNA